MSILGKLKRNNNPPPQDFGPPPDPLMPGPDLGYPQPYEDSHLDQPYRPLTQPTYDYSNPDINLQTGTPKPQVYKEPTQQPLSPPPDNSKDVQLILAKLDAIKSELDSLHQRVRKIESIAEADQQAANKTYSRW